MPLRQNSTIEGTYINKNWNYRGIEGVYFGAFCLFIVIICTVLVDLAPDFTTGNHFFGCYWVQ